MTESVSASYILTAVQLYISSGTTLCLFSGDINTQKPLGDGLKIVCNWCKKKNLVLPAQTQLENVPTSR